MNYRIVYVDAFTDKVFGGNPCAVVPRAEGLGEARMQAIARETNLSETAFVFKSDRADFKVRYFMPSREIPFAGHPTIATAFTLAEEGMVSLNQPITTISFEFNIGVLPLDIIRNESGGAGRVIMTQNPPEFGPKVDRERLARGLGIEPVDIMSDLKSQVVSTGVPFLVVPATGLGVLKKAKMNPDALRPILAEVGVSAVYFFSLNGFDSESALHARLMGPDNSFEDPFTGSAAGCLGAYVIANCLKKGPKLELEQGDIIGRPGRGVIEVHGSPSDIRVVKIGGPAVKSLEGRIFVP